MGGVGLAILALNDSMKIIWKTGGVERKKRQQKPLTAKQTTEMRQHDLERGMDTIKVEMNFAGIQALNMTDHDSTG